MWQRQFIKPDPVSLLLRFEDRLYLPDSFAVRSGHLSELGPIV